MLNFLDLLIKVKYRLRDILFHYLRKPFIGGLGKGSYIKRGVKLLGNPYRIKIGKKFKILENPLKAAGDSGEESTLLSTENCREIK